MLGRTVTVLLACLLAAPARAQEQAAGKKPAEKEAAAPSAEEAALRAALKALSKALQDGDGKAIHRAIYAANPTERKMVDAMSAMAVQIAELYKAAAKAFGEEQAKELTGDRGGELSRIDEAKVSIEGDTATVTYENPQPAKPDVPAGDAAKADDPAAPAEPDDSDDTSSSPPPPMVLKKVDGRWQVPVSELSKDTTPEEIEQRLADLAVQTKVIAELCGEIAAGKYTSADTAAEAWQSKMMQAVTPPRKAEPPKDAKEKDAPKNETPAKKSQ